MGDYACDMSVWISQSLIPQRTDVLALYVCCSNPVCQDCCWSLLGPRASALSPFASPLGAEFAVQVFCFWSFLEVLVTGFMCSHLASSGLNQSFIKGQLKYSAGGRSSGSLWTLIERHLLLSGGSVSRGRLTELFSCCYCKLFQSSKYMFNDVSHVSGV